MQSILESRMVDEYGFLSGVSRWLEIPWWNEPITGIPSSLREKVPARTALRYRVVPLREDEREIWITLSIRLICWLATRWHLRSTNALCMLCRRARKSSRRSGKDMGSARTFEAILEDRTEDELGPDVEQETNVLDTDDSEASVVKFVDQFLREHSNKGQPTSTSSRCRTICRSGIGLTEFCTRFRCLPNIRVLQASVISRLKIMAHLDIAEDGGLRGMAESTWSSTLKLLTFG